ncbi:hypothetical protein ABK040_015576 [Willaertia magna]
MLESPLKKVKLTEEEQLNNSNCHTKSLFTQLPNELFLYITDFLIEEQEKKTLDEKNSKKHYSQEQVNEDLFNRLKLLEFKKDDFISNEIFKSTSLFQYFLFRILMLSLKMFTNIETNADFLSGCGIGYTLLPEEHLEIYDNERQNLSEDEHLKGLVIVKDNSWKRFCGLLLTPFR